MKKLTKLKCQQVFVVTVTILYSMGLFALAALFFLLMNEMEGGFNLMFFGLVLLCICMIVVGDIWIVDNVLAVIKGKKYKIMNKMITSRSKKVVNLDNFQRGA